MPALTGRDAQQGHLVTVYDDRIVLERRDFANDLPAAPDWIVPLPAHASSFAERAKEAPVPEFSAGAEVTVSEQQTDLEAFLDTDEPVLVLPRAAVPLAEAGVGLAYAAAGRTLWEAWRVKMTNAVQDATLIPGWLPIFGPETVAEVEPIFRAKQQKNG